MGTASNNKRQQPANASGNDDVGDISQYIQRADYNPTIEGINARLETLEARVGTNAAMVTTVQDMLEHDRNIDPVMTEYVEKHIDLKPTVQTAVDNMDKRLVKAFMKKTGIWVLGAVWSIILIVVTAWVTANVH